MTTTGGVVSGNSHSYKIANLTFTVTSLKTGQLTEINARRRNGYADLPQTIAGVWNEDGVIKSSKGATFDGSFWGPQHNYLDTGSSDVPALVISF